MSSLPWLPTPRPAPGRVLPFLTRLLLLAGLALLGSLAASAQEGVRRTYDLVAAPAEESLPRLSTQSGLEVVFAPGAVSGVRTNAVRGEYTVLEAVRLLLAETGLEARQDARTGALTVVRASAPAAPERAAPGPAPAGTGDAGVVELSPFVVSSESARGYATTSSTSASRIAVPMTELPTSVIVINEKIIEDTLAVSAEDTLNLIGGVNAFAETTSNQSNRFSARGYTSVGAQRDGFTDLLFGTNGGFNYAFVERIEYVKGPNGILYGEHTPGGMLNFVSKRPLGKPRTKLSVMSGSYGLYRGDLDTSGRLGEGGRLGYRLATSYMVNEGPLGHPGQVFAKKGFLAVNPVVSYNFRNGLEVWAWTGFIRDKSPRMNRITKTFQQNGDGVAHPHPEILDNGLAHNLVTSEVQVTTDSYELGATKSFQLGPVRADARVLARYIEQYDSGALVTTTGSDVFVGKNGAIIGTDARTFNYSLIENNLGGFYRGGLQTTGTDVTTESSTYAADLGFSFKIGPTDHKLLLFGVLNKLDRVSSPGINGRVYAISGTAGLPVLERLGAERVGNVARVWLYPLDKLVFAGISPSVVVANATSFTVQSVTTTVSDQTAYGFMERMSFLDNRAFLVGGMRHTGNEASVRIDNGAPSITDDGSWTSGYGALGKLYRGEKGEVAVFYNANETFVPVFTLDQRLATFGRKFPNRTIAISEYGLKFDLLASRLVATASFFDMEEDNVLVSLIDDDGTITGEVDRSYSVPIGRRHTDGWEVDMALNILRGLDTVISYGKRRARLENGTLPFGQPDATASALARYEVPRGALKGASLLWQYTWWGDSILGTRTSWKVPPGDLHTAVVGYRWKNMNFRFRVENVFDDLSMRPSVNETAVGVTNHRNYRFSVDYQF